MEKIKINDAVEMRTALQNDFVLIEGQNNQYFNVFEVCSWSKEPKIIFEWILDCWLKHLDNEDKEVTLYKEQITS